ncbi:hypothetical protein [Zhouia amylolytica]|uniref:hypothetical protein n=1 Tax=Zhouia amylolytica TaxID=376730 RepID=UPI0020CCBC92|nr:hypothetical protein [Zhouia amylolytica]MCQ0110063.1 hypothetical protein [Zhouia amylolytica]
MKTKIGFCLAFIMTMVLLGCAQEKNVQADEMLKDETKQNEIMTAIVEDHEMMMNMMDHIKKNDHAMQMMRGDSVMMYDMMQGNQMVDLMRGSPKMMGTMMQYMMKMATEDTTACKAMGSMMMGNEHMMRMMQDLMHEKGMMGNGKTSQMHMEQHQHDN